MYKPSRWWRGPTPSHHSSPFNPNFLPRLWTPARTHWLDLIGPGPPSPLPIGSTKHQSPYATSYWPAFLSIRHRVGGTQSAAPASPPSLPPHCLELWTPTGPTAEATAAHRGGAARGSRDSPIRCPTGELNGFPRRKSIAAATAATSSQNQVTATAGAADPSRDPPASPRGGAGRRGLRSAATGPRPLLGYPSAVADATPGRGLGGRAPSHAPEASAR